MDFKYYSLSFPFQKQFARQETNHDDLHGFIDQNSFESDDFHMHIYKVQKCLKHYSHDWRSCPFVHQGEKVQRRDPRKYNYLPIPCPSYKFAYCVKGDHCELSHGVFEYWLHPAKYRTIPCQAGTACDRPVCFFAHTLTELRSETKYNWCYVYQFSLDIQPYPDILIENESKGNWMLIPCNPQLPPLPPPLHDHGYGTTSSEQGTSSSSQQISQKTTSTYELLVSAPPSSSQYHSKFDQKVQNESEFSFFSSNHAKMIEEMKNLDLGNTSHAKISKMYDEKGKRFVECELRDQKFPATN